MNLKDKEDLIRNYFYDQLHNFEYGTCYRIQKITQLIEYDKGFPGFEIRYSYFPTNQRAPESEIRLIKNGIVRISESHLRNYQIERLLT